MVKVKEVVPAFPSAIVTSSILNDGKTLIGRLRFSLSTVTVTTAELLLVEVKCELAAPAVIVPDGGVANDGGAKKEAKPTGATPVPSGLTPTAPTPPPKP